MGYITNPPTSLLGGSPICATNAEAVSGIVTNKMLVPSNLSSIFASPLPLGAILPNSAVVTTLSIGALTGLLLGSSGVVSSLSTVNNSVLSTNNSGIISFSSTLPSAVQANITALGNIISGVWQSTKIAEVYGGTNQNSYITGDILYSSATNTLAKLAGNTTTTKKFFTQTGNGSSSAAPEWNTITSSDISSILSSPTAIGDVTPNTGSFTTLNVSGLAKFGTTSSPTATTEITSSVSTGNQCNYSIVGNSFDGSSDTDGIALCLAHNGSSNRQLAIGDTKLLSSNSSNQVIRVIPNSGLIDSVATNGTTILPIILGNSGNTTSIRGSVINLVSSGSTAVSIDSSQKVSISGSVNISGSSGLPSSGGASLYMSSGYSSPNVGRLIIGDGSGWLFRMSKLNSSTQTDLIYFKDDGSIGLNTTDFGSGNGILAIGNAAVVPSTNPTNAYDVYVQSGALKGRGSSGTVVTIGTADPHCVICGADFMLEWQNMDHGAHLQICVYCLAKDLGSKSYIKIFRTEPKEGEVAWH